MQQLSSMCTNKEYSDIKNVTINVYHHMWSNMNTFDCNNKA